MNRTLFYDRQTGEIVHSHYEVQVSDAGDGAGGRPGAPMAVDADAVLAALLTRGLDPDRLGSVSTSAAPQSSRRTERSVDVATGRLRERRLELTDHADVPEGKAD